ncbi:MAG TPA: hypothetical protein DEW39_15460 [Brevibacterium sp.]|uniref:Uncharacterized protein n=2 Tax=Brevibacterium antiquum TaxID=234835 RepID=A0A2H1HK95_9MICO|nr:hypothetical protein BANT918_00042 [Brevibacterium antiquum CNRZ 918]SMX63926.1 hypothetical protein BANT10_00040 [Brevibacterium antiquum]HCG57484.1 hypothetical protein [Brevibacterium sp.]
MWHGVDVAQNSADTRTHLALIAVVSFSVIVSARWVIGAAAPRSSCLGTVAEDDAVAGVSEPSAAARTGVKRPILFASLPLVVVAICGTAVEDIAHKLVAATLVPGALRAAAHIPAVWRAGGVTLVGIIASFDILCWGLRAWHRGPRQDGAKQGINDVDRHTPHDDARHQRKNRNDDVRHEWVRNEKCAATS